MKMAVPEDNPSGPGTGDHLPVLGSKTSALSLESAVGGPA